MATKEVQKTISNVREFVRDTLRANEQVDAMEEFQDHGKVQINVRVPSYNAFHLEQLAKHLRMSRSDLALELLVNAIADAWSESGLPDSLEDESLKRQLSAYMEAHSK